ncbi:MAG: hypothetical protein ACP5JG_05640 [Anaerolineae bacterium]
MSKGNPYVNGFAGGLAMLVVIGLMKGLHPETLDMHRPWHLLKGPGISNEEVYLDGDLQFGRVDA